MKNKDYIKLIAVGVVLVVLLFALPRPSVNLPDQTQLKKFNSQSELTEFLNRTPYSGLSSGTAEMRTLSAQSGAPTAAPMMADQGAKSESYSTTNIQVAGVDESDFIKNDGKYIYTIAGNEVVIVDAYPAESSGILSKINLSGINPNQLYINGDRLVVFGSVYNYYPGPMMQADAKIGGMMPRYGTPETSVKVYDVTDRANPVLKRDLLLNGSYYNSRMIGDYVYAILNVPAYNDLPVFSPYQRGFPEIYYFDVPSYSHQFTNIIALNVKDDTTEMQNKVFLLDYSTNLFVSQENIYLVYQKQIDQRYLFNRLIDEAVLPNVPADIQAAISAARGADNAEYEIGKILQDWLGKMDPETGARVQQQIQEKFQQVMQDLQKELQKSVIHKISVKDGSINYVTKGEVPGTPLNQFSMDEYNGYFRIATTTGEVWNGNSVNNVYVLDSGMSVVGRVEDLAKGERIYSARFMGDRAYMVTFKKIDPLFVLDLSNPAAPQVLGELKIPGYSDYLHPYDETHIIGIGKNAVDASLTETEQRSLNFAWYQGVKLALFDVSDVANPREVSTFIIGDRGTNSEALYDHRAFLFSKEKSLLVVPIQLAEINRTMYGENPPANAYGNTVWVGAYVFKLDLDGFALKGRVTHADNFSDYSYWNSQISRSLYIGENLYTVSQKMIKANALDDLSEKAKIELPYTEYGYVMY